jgi:hypothetical protein
VRERDREGEQLLIDDFFSLDGWSLEEIKEYIHMIVKRRMKPKKKQA